jgi:hypothetical protein
MPEEIINKFKKEYGPEGEKIYYATANKQGRDPETFKKESTMENVSLEQLEKQLEEEMAQFSGVLIPSSTTPEDKPIIGGSLTPPSEQPVISPTLAPGLPETAPGQVVPPAATVPPSPQTIPPTPIVEKKEKDAEKENIKNTVKQVGSLLDRSGNKHLPPSSKVFKSKKEKAAEKERRNKNWEKFDESVNSYILKTSRMSDIGVNSLEKIWAECVENQTKGEHPRSSRKFWLEVKHKFDNKVNDIFLQEAKNRMSERQKLSASIETFLENVAKDKYVEAKQCVKEMAQSCVNSMISERKVQYQKTLAEEIAKKVREAK